MKQEIRDRLARELERRLTKQGRTMSCPMCASPNFVIADGAHLNVLQESIIGLSLGGQSIPAAILVCTNCGFLSEHAIGSLMSLDEYREMSKEEPKPKEDVKVAATGAEAARGQ